MASFFLSSSSIFYTSVLCIEQFRLSFCILDASIISSIDLFDVEMAMNKLFDLNRNFSCVLFFFRLS